MTRGAVVVMQFTPRGFDQAGAAGYTGPPVSLLPPPSITRGRTMLWLREDLDAALNRLAGSEIVAPADWSDAR